MLKSISLSTDASDRGRSATSFRAIALADGEALAERLAASYRPAETARNRSRRAATCSPDPEGWFAHDSSRGVSAGLPQARIDAGGGAAAAQLDCAWRRG